MEALSNKDEKTFQYIDIKNAAEKQAKLFETTRGGVEFVGEPSTPGNTGRVRCESNQTGVSARMYIFYIP